MCLNRGAACLGGTRRSMSRPHDRAHVIGHAWPWSPGLPAQKFSEFLWRWPSTGGGGGASRGGVGLWGTEGGLG